MSGEDAPNSPETNKDVTPAADRRTVRRLIDEDEPEFEEVLPSDLESGDWILAYPGERLLVDGVVVKLRYGTGGTADGSIESSDGSDSRPVVVDERVHRQEVVRGVPIVVEYRSKRGVPLLAVTAVALGLKLFSRFTRRAVLITVLTVVVITGGAIASAYFGSDVSRVFSGEENDDTSVDRTPEPPTVIVTPPSPTPDENDDSSGSDGSGTSDGTSPPTPTPAQTATPTSTPTRTATPVQTDTTNRRSGNSDPPPISAEISVFAEDPSPIRRADGGVETLSGNVSGTISWSGGSVSSIIIVVNTWAPNDGWDEERRVLIQPDPTIELADVFDSPIMYASGGRASGFSNPHDGTTRETTGYVSVTAVFYDGSREAERVEATGSYTATVVNVEGSAETGVRLQLGEGGTDVSLLDSGGHPVAPGWSGTNRGTLRNTGIEPGHLEISNVSYASFGCAGPPAEADSACDDPDEGDLHRFLRLRAVIEHENGTHYDVVGDATTFRSLTDVEGETIWLGHLEPGEELTLHIDWQVGMDAGNEVQGDTVVVAFEFRLIGNTEG